VTLFICGDVMTGRGIDQILPNRSPPHLYESYVQSAETYVELAEQAFGAIPRNASLEYIWGDALTELELVRPAARIVNLETAVTSSEEAWPDKGIHYRMHPANVACLTAAGIDCCVLANNHVLDWGYAGLEETLAVLRGAGIRSAGAGHDAKEAAAPAVLALPGGLELLVFSFGFPSSGVPQEWCAEAGKSGVNWLPDLSERSVEEVARQVSSHRRPGRLLIASLHWGSNWGYTISRRDREFAHRLIDTAGVHLVHGHSSHHVKGIEVYRGKAILYGCGDLLNDYEGIGGYESFRGDLALMYFPALDISSGDLVGLTMSPTQTRRFRINRAPPEDASWLAQTLERECARLGTHVTPRADRRLELHWTS
jgi:poly-gamma-glutamate capsule biosynthesis protein CapA/YwtB (metallophosphatase superfamily)